MRQRRGFSLLEAIIVLSMMIALLVLVAMYFVRGQQYTVDTETYASVQRNSTVILRKITSDLFKSTIHQIGFSAGEDAVWFLSSGTSATGQPFLEFNSTNGKIIWRKWVCYYHDPVNRSIIRAEAPLTPPDSELIAPVSPSPSLSFFQTGPGVTRQPIGQQVKSFRVSSTTKGVIVSLTTHAEAPLTNTNLNEREVEITISAQVTLIN